MVDININLTKKQSIAWKYLMDETHTEVLFGGSKGSAKTYLGTLWVTIMCLQYPGIRALIGRTALSQLRVTTIKTLLDLFKNSGIKPGDHYHYNQQTNEIKFYNKSEIIFKDLQSYPSDPNQDALGGTEITIAFIDEAAQISRTTYDVVRSLLRYKITEFNLTPKLLMTCNPSQNWLKQEFFVPHMNGTLPPNKVFVQGLPTDNPHLPKSYLDILRSLPPKQRKRLYEGDWNFDEDEDTLFDFELISNSIYKHQIDDTEKKYISVDVARFGEDKTVAIVWVGLTIIEINIYKKLSTTDVTTQLRGLIQSHGVHPSNIIVDSDGVGGGVADQIRGKNFINNSRPLHNQNFTNLKSQCYVKLSEMFEKGVISININDPNIIDELTQELLSVKLKNVDRDNKVQVLSKEEQKKLLGRSPDISDAMMMGMLPHIQNNKTTGKYSLSFL